MGRLIKHFGVVEEVNKDVVRVKIIHASACSGCSAQKICSSSECKDKLIDVTTFETDQYEKDQSVVIQGTISMGMQAVFFAYVVPFLLVLFTLFVTMSITQKNEFISALAGLAILIPYYVILYLFKNQLKKKFSFTIKSIK